MAAEYGSHFFAFKYKFKYGILFYNKLIIGGNYRMKDEELEQYKDMLVPILMEFLRKLNSLEKIYFCKTRDFEKLYQGNTIPEELCPVIDKIWSDYGMKKKDILRQYCTPKITEVKYLGRSLKEPAKFEFIEGDYQLRFIMKSTRKAIIELDYEEWKGSTFSKQFSFSNTESGWKVNEMKERLGEDEAWTKICM